MYYIYYLMDPRTGLPFYVGKGKGNRAHHHLENRGRQYNDYKIAKIKKIRSLGLEPYIHYPIVGIEDEETAYYIEEVHTLMYGRKGIEENGILTNRIVGDRSPANLPEVREKIRIARTGSKATEDTRRRRSESHLAKGDKHHNKDPKVRAKRSATMLAKGENHHNKTADARKKISDKTENKVKISVDGVVYDSVTTAANTTGIKRGTLFYRSGSNKFPNIFIIDDRKEENRQVGAGRKSVIVDGKTYESIDRAARSIGVSSPTIRNRINSNKWPTYKFVDYIINELR